MKKKISYFKLISFILLLFLVACSNESDTKNESIENKTDTTKNSTLIKTIEDKSTWQFSDTNAQIIFMNNSFSLFENSVDYSEYYLGSYDFFYGQNAREELNNLKDIKSGELENFISSNVEYNEDELISLILTFKAKVNGAKDEEIESYTIPYAGYYVNDTNGESFTLLNLSTGEIVTLTRI